ncbi:MAG: hypothetical protein RM049_34970 [Nostoc sp. DedQUE04]|uniref:hypothetical protein n=1 Tax=Nostoc sp. DedQUE04 TaxID=3075390 RepID=UPI002AD33AA6|nr:hypothetical protein [Nostoc sp. DedQUE04]MDZ8140439.1 hypothetical protein [Nostoc sp. DedQUE04]
MNASLLSLPKFHSGQKVEFIGGEGIIKNYRPQSGSWEPEIGRVGYETMIWLSEVDIYSPFNNSFHNKIRNHEHHELKMQFLQVAKATKHHSNDNN